MISQSSTKLSALSAVVMLALLSTGCATKKYVGKMISPLETRLGKNETKTSENTQQINQVDQRATEGITSAQNKADEASQQATQAGQAAQSAQNLAQKGVDQATSVDQKLENADNYQVTKTATVLFGFNKSQLTDDDKQQLDQIAQTASSLKHFVIQVQGYTDATGSTKYNLELSRRRADAVVRYLTEKNNIPLVKVSLLGYGEDSPAAPNKTRDGRKENRRVQITIMAPPWAANQSQAQVQSSTSSSAALNNNK